MHEAQGATHIDILMYHSIADDPGPTSIAPDAFRMQIETLVELGYSAVPLADVPAWRAGERYFPEKSVIITFDDAFADFTEVAHPILRKAGFTATVFVPTAHLGGVENWYGTAARPRKLMRWEDVRALGEYGVDFGGHSLSHADLTSLAGEDLRAEIADCRDAIEQHVTRPVRCFAAPYGRINDAVRAEISRHYSVAAGVSFARANTQSDVFDLPRIEMYYYRDEQRWRDHLEGRGSLYMLARQALRGVRTALAGGPRREA